MDATTVYRVVTRYEIEDRGASSANLAYTRSALELDRANRRARESFLGIGSAAGLLGRALLPVGVGLLAKSALSATFRNLNQDMNATLGLASQLNLVFAYDRDPGKSFALSMQVSRDFMRDIIRDAAKLPGELGDFQAAMRTMAPSALFAGGDLATVRRMLGNLSILAPAAGQGMTEAGRQTGRMLTGQAGQGDNPLFAYLLNARMLPNAEAFNALPAARRLELVDAAFQKLAGNPFLRREVLRTFDTQLGTLKDTLFGVEGILGNLLKGPFSGFLGRLREFNEYLGDSETNRRLKYVGDRLSHEIRAGLPREDVKGLIGPDAGGSRGGLGSLAKWWDGFSTQWQRSNVLNEAATAAFRRELKASGQELGLWTLALTGGGLFKSPRFWELRAEKELEFLRLEARQYHAGVQPLLEALGFPTGALTVPKDPKRRDEFTLGGAGTVNHNQITIKIDLKSDDSPEAIAVKLTKGLEKAQRFPTRSTRAPQITPRPRY